MTTPGAVGAALLAMTKVIAAEALQRSFHEWLHRQSHVVPDPDVIRRHGSVEGEQYHIAPLTHLPCTQHCLRTHAEDLILGELEKVPVVDNTLAGIEGFVWLDGLKKSSAEQGR